VTLSIYKRAGYVVFLDDESDFLEILSQVIPSGWLTKMYDDPNAVIHRIQGETKRLGDEVWHHQNIIERSIEGESRIAQLLAYWRNDGFNRYATTRLLVVDYSMPQQSGLQVLSQLEDWPGGRIMLTGQADELIAVNAFNQGLIQQYIPKQSSNLATRIISGINDRLDRPAVDDLGKIWRNNLSREQLALIKNPAAAAWLEGLVNAHGLVEYGVVGAPFGILGLNAQGQGFWIQIEQSASTRSLDELADTLSGYDVSAADMTNIREGKVISDFELKLAIQATGPLQLKIADFMPDSTSVSVAVFTIDPQLCPGPTASLSALAASSNSNN
jgi:CheY-like chemotaxis protein